ncbi:MAG: ABC transporter ATP-binding protein [Filifactoraceae bacterium]
MIDKVLEIKNLNKKYDEFQLQDISFFLNRREVTGLIGKNGAGKSTTMKSILKIINKDSGEILFNGNDIEKDNNNKYRMNIGYVGEKLNFFPNISLKEIKIIYSQFYSKWDEEYFLSLMNKFEMDENLKMNNISKGMKVKFSIALSLSHFPDLLLLDEPTSGLDPIIRYEILNLLREYVNKNGSALLFSSHITEDLEKISDNLIFMKNGKIISYKKTIEIMDKYKKVDNYIKEIYGLV